MTSSFALLLEPGEAVTSTGSQLLAYGEVLLALAGVLVLAYVVLRVGLPRMMGMPSSKGGPIEIVARHPLEPKKTLYLVRMGPQLFLIAASDTQVQFLTSVAPENVEELLASVKVAEPQGKIFRQVMSQFRQS
jgi:flagellar biogenesis protein FliO